MPAHNSYGEVELNVVAGNSLHGRHPVSGGINVVVNDGSSYTGRNHPSGAINGVITTSRAQAVAPNGSAYIILQRDGVGYTLVG